MREILFRGKRVDNREWVIDKGVYVGDFGKSFIVHYLDGLIEVIPESVGQFTGLTDKNGEKIFEGDILIDKSKYGNVIAKVVFESNTFRLLGMLEPNLYWNFNSNWEIIDCIHK